MASTGKKEEPRRQCGTMQVHYALLEEDPAFRARLSALEHTTRMRRMAVSAKPWRVPTIPVVVHVLHRVAKEDISDKQIENQIAVLNRDYRRKNPDVKSAPKPFAGLAADAGVEFKLAKVIRKATKNPAFGDDDGVKAAATGGSNPVRSKDHLNLWVCTLTGGLLGYAQFPGGPVATDGVVIRNTAFGTGGSAKSPFNLGRTTTHEVGHWLNLRHIWGDTPDCSGGDSVGDTPNAEGPNYGAPKFPHVSCGNGPSGDLFVNYMDYVDDKAMFLFTHGQVQRMRTALETVRKAFLP